MRVAPSEKSEMVSQVLFGETVAVLQRKKQWVYVRTKIDDYLGWVSANMIVGFLDGEHPAQVVSAPFAVCRVMPDNSRIYVPGGSLFPDVSWQYGSKTYLLEKPALHAEPQDIVALAGQYLGAPYLWGGKTVFGIDCSGLVQVVCRMVDQWLPRDADQQEQCGTNITFEQAAKGDLAFFGNAQQKVVHVGILCNKTSIIHASGCVRIDRFDRQGIFNQDENRYTHQLYSIKRLS